jgi:hypothetical protein
MVSRDVGKAEDDIAAFTSPNEQLGLAKLDGVTPSKGNQFTENGAVIGGVAVHGGPHRETKKIKDRI